MTIFEFLTWLVLGAVLGVLVAAFWRTEGLTFLRSIGVGVFGAIVGGLIGRILFVPGPYAGTMGAVTPALLFAGVGAVVTVVLARIQLRRERPRFG